ncbi:MAG: class I SAM-dependent methyltransferase [archaeon]
MDYKEYKSGESIFKHFWHRGRRDLLYTLVLKLKKKNLRILNLGAGTGDDLEVLNNFGEVYVIDIEKRALDLIPKELYKEKKVCDACDLSYNDNFFDAIISSDVFEHIKDHKKAFEESYRVLKKGGYLIFAVPAFQFLYSSHDRALEHKRRYSKKILRNLLKQFNELELNYWNFFLSLPQGIIKFKNRNAKPKVDSPNFPLSINNIFYQLLRIENYLIKKNFRLPFGLTIIGIYQK